jgi:hypothetical protein
MTREPVSSSNVAEVGYDENQRVLEVKFKNGGLYQYFEVPSRIYSDLLQAASVGKFLNANVKGSYRYAKV